MCDAAEAAVVEMLAAVGLEDPAADSQPRVEVVVAGFAGRMGLLGLLEVVVDFGAQRDLLELEVVDSAVRKDLPGSVRAAAGQKGPHGVAFGCADLAEGPTG